MFGISRVLAQSARTLHTQRLININPKEKELISLVKSIIASEETSTLGVATCIKGPHITQEAQEFVGNLAILSDNPALLKTIYIFSSITGCPSEAVLNAAKKNGCVAVLSYLQNNRRVSIRDFQEAVDSKKERGGKMVLSYKPGDSIGRMIFKGNKEKDAKN
jgi:hypothetical protein